MQLSPGKGGGAQMEEKFKVLLTQVPLSDLGNKLKHSRDPRVKLFSWQAGQVCVHHFTEGRNQRQLDDASFERPEFLSSLPPLNTILLEG